MKPTWLAVLALPLLASCTLSSSNLNFEVFPDKSGTFEHAMLVVEQSGPKEGEGPFQGMTMRESTRVRLSQVKADFAAVDALDVGGISLAWAETKGGWTLTATIPTTAEAEWVKRLAPTREQLEAARKALRDGIPVPGQQQTTGRMMAPHTDEDQVGFAVLSVRMPGTILTSKVEGASFPVQVGQEAQIMFGAGEMTGKDTTWLRIPLAAVFDGKTPSVTWTVACGPLTPEREFAWDQLRHTRGDADADDRACEGRLRELSRRILGRAKADNAFPGGTGREFLKAVAPEDLRGCPAGKAYRGPARAASWVGASDDVLVCDAPGAHPGGIHAITRMGQVVWIGEKSERHGRALELTTEK